MATTKKVKRVRDITLALSLVQISLAHARAIINHAEDGEYNPEINAKLCEYLVQVAKTLEGLNASTGKREKGKGAALNVVGGASAAKKAGARRR